MKIIITILTSCFLSFYFSFNQAKNIFAEASGFAFIIYLFLSFPITLILSFLFYYKLIFTSKEKTKEDKKENILTIFMIAFIIIVIILALYLSK